MLDCRDNFAINLPELIAAAGEVAFEYAENDIDGRRLARLALIEFLRNTPNTANLNDAFSAPTSGPESLQ
jgi:hypothetical protein